MSESYRTLPPSLLSQWLHSLPYPALIIADNKEIILANKASREVLSILNSQSNSFDSDLLLSLASSETEQESARRAYASGEFFATAVSVGDQGSKYFLRAVRLVDGDRNYFCCVLTPTGSDMFFNQVLDSAACPIIHCTPQGRVKHANRSLYSLLGYNPQDKAITELKDIDAGFDHLPFREAIHSVLHSGETRYETQYRTKAGNLLPMRVTIVQDQLSPTLSFILTAQNISEQRQREAELAEALEKIKSLSRKVPERPVQTVAELDSQRNYRLEYVSQEMDALIRNIEQVAPLDTTVLIQGETGTGKEVVARTIHQLSLRAKLPFVVVDCGALPASLIESELFGYRKGAFTGAQQDHAGKLEVADGGTIFLDEIGEMPLDLQSRLLRVLQEREFQRIGDHRPRRVNARFIAATNRDLAAMVRKGSFRADLFFRLNVFPLKLSPLRERSDDVIHLLRYYIRKFNGEFGLEIDGDGLQDSDLEGFKQYPFPGNVRELENIVRRAFITSEDNQLDFNFPPTGTDRKLPRAEEDGKGSADDLISRRDGQQDHSGDGTNSSGFLSFEAFQRQYIERVLRTTGGKVSGQGGAAEILNMNPQTLFSKMKKLGIKR